MTVTGGGQVTDSAGFIAVNPGEVGAVTVSGVNSTWTNSGNVFAGYNGTGTLNIETGGTVTDTFGLIGYNPGSSGNVTVSDATSTWTNTSLNVGSREGVGTLTIQSGRTVTDTFGNIGNLPGSSGTVTVTGPNATWTTASDLHPSATMERANSPSRMAGWASRRLRSIHFQFKIWARERLTLAQHPAPIRSRRARSKHLR